MDTMKEELYLKIKEYVEILEDYVVDSKISGEEKSIFLDQILVIKTGAKLPLNYFAEHKEARDFFDINDFGNIFFTSKVTARYDSYDGLLIPIEITKEAIAWFQWDSFTWRKTKDGYTVKRDNLTLFKTDAKKKLTDDYFVMLFGIVKYNRIKSANLRPFKKVNNKTKGCYFDIMISYVDKKKVGTSYILEAHVHMELTDKEGFVKSFGQDIFDHIRMLPFYGFFRAGESSSILRSPDAASYYPHNFRNRNVIRFSLSQKEHDRIIAIVESDKHNSQRVAELLKGNCVSYTARIVKLGLNYCIKTDHSLIEILGRELMPRKYDESMRRWGTEINKKSKWIEIAIYCFPPFYLITFLLGVFMISSAFWGFKNHREYNVMDSLFRPWKIRCDIPRIMLHVLSKYTDKKGEIDRKKYPPGTIFD